MKQQVNLYQLQNNKPFLTFNRLLLIFVVIVFAFAVDYLRINHNLTNLTKQQLQLQAIHNQSAFNIAKPNDAPSADEKQQLTQQLMLLEQQWILKKQARDQLINYPPPTISAPNQLLKRLVADTTNLTIEKSI